MDRTGEDLGERFAELLDGRLRGAGAAPADEAVGANQDRSVASDPPVAQPHAARVVEFALDVADPNRVQRNTRFGGEFVRSVAPRTAIFAGD